MIDPAKAFNSPNWHRTDPRNCAACEYRRFNLDKTFFSYHLACLHRLQISALNLFANLLVLTIVRRHLSLSNHYRPTLSSLYMAISRPIPATSSPPFRTREKNSFGSEIGLKNKYKNDLIFSSILSLVYCQNWNLQSVCSTERVSIRQRLFFLVWKKYLPFAPLISKRFTILRNFFQTEWSWLRILSQNPEDGGKCWSGGQKFIQIDWWLVFTFSAFSLFDENWESIQMESALRNPLPVKEFCYNSNWSGQSGSPPEASTGI